MLADNSKVICPNCCNQFSAIPVTVQDEISTLRAENAALKKDATRYWVLQERLRIELRTYGGDIEVCGDAYASVECLDNDIDAELAKEKPC